MMDCPHGMPNPKTCMDCMEEGNLPVAKWKRIDTPFTAMFAGICAACSNEFAKGDEIQRWDKEDQASKYTHAWGCGL